jgi:hypothetical protein
VSTIFQIPLIAAPQKLTITLSGVEYQLTLQYRNTNMGGWTLDIADSSGTPLVQGIPLVTGADLLAQYAYLGFGGQLLVQTSSNPDAVPTFDNLGTDGNLYWVTNP